MNERQEGLGEFVVAHGNASELLDAVEEALDQVAVLVDMLLAALATLIAVAHHLRDGTSEEWDSWEALAERGPKAATAVKANPAGRRPTRSVAFDRAAS